MFPVLAAADGVEAQEAEAFVRRGRAPERKGKRVESGKEEVKRWDLFCSERWPGGRMGGNRLTTGPNLSAPVPRHVDLLCRWLSFRDCRGCVLFLGSNK